ncbi:MAG: iron-sulfur cluster assembly accessory protein [Candidatus Kapabacteria bacterium]|nr:iron-sulfur cluster assembly accessory protein [Candidatus Kapabacteria bacterium]
MLDVMEEVEIISVQTGINGAEEQDDFSMTVPALEMINSIRTENEIPEDYYLRLGTRSGGCSGMNYTLGFDSEVNENDKIIDVRGLQMVIDNKSLFYLMGVTLDFTEGPSGSGFFFYKI